MYSSSLREVCEFHKLILNLKNLCAVSDDYFIVLILCYQYVYFIVFIFKLCGPFSIG